jgi:hypothetical protein
MGVFVPGGQAGEEGQRLTHEAEVQAAERREVRDAERSSRPSLLKRILRRLRRTK